jgi:hypothetical protein
LLREDNKRKKTLFNSSPAGRILGPQASAGVSGMLNGQIHASLAENEDDQIDFDDHNYGNDDINNRP